MAAHVSATTHGHHRTSETFQKIKDESVFESGKEPFSLAIWSSGGSAWVAELHGLQRQERGSEPELCVNVFPVLPPGEELFNRKCLCWAP